MLINLQNPKQAGERHQAVCFIIHTQLRRLENAYFICNSYEYPT